MKPETEALAKRLSKESLLDQFLLVGGTALSVHLEHRHSEDLDLPKTSQLGEKWISTDVNPALSPYLHKPSHR